jgi:ABC-type dipeptide/oligopeptide/nickel transport system permease subunit
VTFSVVLAVLVGSVAGHLVGGWFDELLMAWT